MTLESVDLPLHRRVSDELRRDIAAGRPSAGEALATETELMARFGVSRGTVRQALAALRSEGWIAGGQGAPPVVRRPPLSQPFTELISFSAWVRSLGREPGGQVVDFERHPPEAPVTDALRLRPGEPAYHLVRVRLADGEPLMIERTVFPAEVGMLVERLDLARQSIYAELASAGIIFDSAHQEIDALCATAVDARLLGVARRAPLLRLTRLSYSPQGRPLEWSDDRYLGDRVSLSIDQSSVRPSLARRLTAV
jgi:GntR family transcriptional regulator